MRLQDKVVLVTGGGNGIGRALCRRFAAEGARGVTVVDLDAEAAAAVAGELGDAGLAHSADVSVEADVVAAVQATEERFGPIDLLVSNAGIAIAGGEEVPDEAWQQIWDVNVMAHVYAARAVLPAMLARGEGYLLNTGSAAGLLTNIGAAPYSVTKHAAVALAEWLAVTYGDQGIQVSCLCPQGVRTNMLLGGVDDAAGAVVLAQGAIEPEDVAQTVVQGLAAETFLILPHPEVLTHFQRKAGDYDRWLDGMRRLQGRITSAAVREPVPTASADSALLQVGLRPGDRVRFRPSGGGAWKEARVERRERDGSIGVRDERGAARAIPVGRLELRIRGPRGGTAWEPVAVRAQRNEQLGIW